MDQVVILLVVGVIAFLNWLVKRRQESQQDTPPPTLIRTEPPAINRQRGQSEQERMRRFAEALGIPPGSSPPRPAQKPRQATPPPVPAQRPRFEAARRELIEQRPQPKVVPLVMEISEPPPIQKILPQATPINPTVVSDAYAIASRPALTAAEEAATLRVLLRSPASVRTAILLREILGPPKGLQSSIGAHSFP